jgi:hypothetical protein
MSTTKEFSSTPEEKQQIELEEEIVSQINKVTAKFSKKLTMKQQQLLKDRNEFQSEYAKPILKCLSKYITKLIKKSQKTLIQQYLIIREDGFVFMKPRNYHQLMESDTSGKVLVKNSIIEYMIGMNDFYWEKTSVYKQKIGIKEDRIQLVKKWFLEYFDKSGISHTESYREYEDDFAIVISFSKNIDPES